MSQGSWSGGRFFLLGAVVVALATSLLGLAFPVRAEAGTVLICVRNAGSGSDPQGQAFGGSVRVVSAAPCATGETLITLVTDDATATANGSRLVDQEIIVAGGTDGETFDDLASGSFESLAEGCVVVTLSMQIQAATSGDQVVLRARVGTTVMSPSPSVTHTFDTTTPKLLAFTFLRCFVAAGTHDWDVQWKVGGSGQQVTLAGTTVLVHAP